MTNKKVKIQSLVENQLPSFVQNEYPLFIDFLKQYYISQEYQSAVLDIIRNLSNYIKPDSNYNQILSADTILSSNISFSDSTISVESTLSWPDSYGLLKIDNEIITYTSKDDTTFYGCVRGFSGITEYGNTLTFEETSSEDHTAESIVENLSILFLQKFFEKIKYQYLFGFENRTLASNVNQSLFLKNSKDFYSSKGTDRSFEILFRVLFGKEVKLIKPQNNLLKPSQADFNYTNDIVVYPVSGNILALEGKTVRQDADKNYSKIQKSFGTVKNVEELYFNGKNLYKLSLDYGYDKDIPVTGSIFGNFQAVGFTKVTDIGENTLNVDSTVGFPKSGSLIIDDSVSITYTDKNSTQFLNCSSVANINIGSDAKYDYNCYGYDSDGNKVQFKVLSVLSNLENLSNIYGLHKNQTILTDTPGSISKKTNPKFNTWTYNISSNSDVYKIEVENLEKNLFRVTTFDPHLFLVNDSITLFSEDGSSYGNIAVISILDDYSFICNSNSLGSSNLNKKYKVRRNIIKSKFDFFTGSEKYQANVQNVYTLDDNSYIFSNSLPPKVSSDGGSVSIPTSRFSSFVDIENDIISLYSETDDRDHGFYTGDIIEYVPGTYTKLRYSNSGTLLRSESPSTPTDILTNNIVGIESGSYYVKRIDSKKIKLSSSLSNIYGDNYIDIGSVGIASTYVRTNYSTYYEVINNVTPQSFYKKEAKIQELKDKRIVKRVKSSVEDQLGKIISSNSNIGILVDGVEVKTYKSNDFVYYGSIESIEVIDKGTGYDVINPPNVIVTDSVGYGFTGSPVVSGSLSEIEVQYGGCGYISTPTIEIKGGNGKGAKAEAKMALIDNVVKFDSTAGVNTATNTITFDDPHNFVEGEKIVYNTFYGNPIGIGSTSSDTITSYYLTNNSTYFAKIVDENKIKLCSTLSDCFNNNPINLTELGNGTQTFKSFEKKNIIKSVEIISSGTGYEYKKRLVSYSGINTSLNTINFKDHDFNSGEIITYQTTGTPISGLSTSNSYYVTVVDKDNFKLSEIASSPKADDWYYKNQQYVDLTSSGTGSHIFQYPPIIVTAVGNIGIFTSTSVPSYNAILKPKFLGSIKLISVENGGVGYGSSEIINFERTPLAEISSGSGAYLKPIILDGSIVDVAVLNSGSGYTSSPKLTVYGEGKYAVLTPNIVDGKITSVTVINGGINYVDGSTIIDITTTGKDAKIKANIKKWQINLVEKNKNVIKNDDGYVITNLNTNNLEFSYLYAPRYLRSILYQINSDGTKEYSSLDLDADTSLKQPLHSPIIGWAYDGNPIYGPYGFSAKTGGTPRLMKSGYELKLLSNRPPFSNGFFIDDYVFTGKGDLDEYNGRFCVTPEYPNGVYAYFMTIDTDGISASGNFKGYRSPVFPYVIGGRFKNKEDDFNFKSINQDNFDINDNNLLRITHPYKVELKNSHYEFIPNQNTNQLKSTVKSILPSSIKKINVRYGGSDYKVNDVVNLPSTEGNTFAYVEKIAGKKIVSFATSTITIEGVKFNIKNLNGDIVATTNYPHNLNQNDIVNISGLSTDSIKNLKGSHKIGINTSTFSLISGIGSTSATGIVTFIGLNGNLNLLTPDDILGIGTEQLLVLNVDSVNSRVRVQRNYNSIPGFASTHSSLETVKELSRRFTFNVGILENYQTNTNRKYYFDPSSSVGIGTTTSSIVVTLPGLATTDLTILSKTIYLPDHNFKTGQQLRYSYSGESIGFSTTGISTFTLTNNSLVYAIKVSKDLLGISTNPVGVGSTSFVGLGSTYTSSLYFNNVGDGKKHSFETVENELTGKISKSLTTILTEENHGLSNEDEIDLSVSPSAISTSIVVSYNNFNKRLVINPVTISNTGIDTTNNLINVSNSFNTGDKVIYESDNPASPLQNNGMYYIRKYDSDSFYLYNTKYDLEHDIFVGIASSGGSLHKFSSINPKIDLFNGHIVNFDLSSVTLSEVNKSSTTGIDTISSFDFKLFEDEDCQIEYFNSNEDGTFATTNAGKIGLTTDARLTLDLTGNVPESLYYKLVPTYDSAKEVFNDSDVSSNNLIKVQDNYYNKKYKVSVGLSTEIYLINEEIPNTYSYTTLNSNIKYTTNSKVAKGGIENVKILYSSNTYENTPGISSITTVSGKNAILEVSNSGIGKISKLENQSLGYGYGSDFSLKPRAIVPQNYKINQLSTIDNIGITSAGKNYTLSPQLIVIDRVTREQNSDFALDSEIKGSGISNVNILSKQYTLYDTDPIILPKNGTNGIGVTNVTYNSASNEVTATLNVVFSDSGSFPFSAGQKILVENIGISSTGSGYNSSDYGYELFTINSVNENLGLLGSVTYKLPYGTTNPGTYSTTKSYGSIIAENSLPIFDVQTSKNNFFKGENILVDNEIVATVDFWDNENKILSLLTTKDIPLGSVLRGGSSGGRGVLLEKESFDINYSLNSYRESDNFTWNNTIGFLNNPTQVMPDNNYYQNFSYAVQSDISYENWNESVSSLVHASGFKKFSNLQIENYQDIRSKNTVAENATNTIIDLVSEISLNCIKNFDFASEKTIDNLISKEIIFKNKILSNYVKSISNRSLQIDDLSSQFNNNPRSTPYSVIDEFDLDDSYHKYIIYLEDSLYYGEREIVICSFIQDQGFSWMSTYGRTESVFDLGRFDFSVSGNKGQLLFYPTKYEYNDYTARFYSYRLKSDPTNLSSINLGDFVSIGSTYVAISSSPSPSSSSIFSFSTSSYSSSKLIVQAKTTDENKKYQTNEISIVQNGSNIEFIDYGQLNSVSENLFAGIGTFGVNISGSNANLQFTPISGIGVTFNISYINFASSGTGIGSTNTNICEITSSYVSISSSPSPSTTNIASYEINHHDAAYHLINIIDKTNNQIEFVETLSVYNEYDIFMSQYGNINTFNNLGVIGITSSSGYAYLTFTPNPDIDVEVRVLQNSLVDNLTGPEQISIGDVSIDSGRGLYQGTKVSIKRSFDLTHKTFPIFSRDVHSSGINTSTDIITIPNHYFVTGEEIKYTPVESLSSNAIGIATTSFVGVGTTSLLPTKVYVVKENENEIKLAKTSQDALSLPPIYLDLTSTGIGTNHTFTSTKQDTKCLISIDNNIQSPLVSTPITTTLSEDLNSFSSIVGLTTSQNFVGSDLIRIDDEYMKIKSIGYAGDLNKLIVERAWMGSENTTHGSGSLVTKYEGNYTIIGNTINFIEAPYGKNPPVNLEKPDEIDWTGIQTSSSFNGRAFIRNAGVGATIAYDNNYVFDDISPNFDGVENDFTLYSNNQGVIGVSTNTGIVLINEIFQTPGINQNYTLSQNAGITTISFIGLGVSAAYDVNTSSLPRGGIIVSVGSSQGFGYQPLVSAGGTAIVSTAGTIQSISIGNSGSGYRSGIQTAINVSIAKTNNSGITSYINVGVATALNGNVVSVAITNPGTGYTSSNPPLVIFDAPLNYSNLTLKYATGYSGLGTEAKINVIVGQGSSIIDFEIQNFGYNYQVGDVLTIPVGGSTGIPTTGIGITEFTLSVENVFNDKFSAWTFGQLELLDDISSEFDGVKKLFDLMKDGAPVSFVTEKGSPIDIQSNLIVFVNNILQVPGQSYIFNGGSVIQFTEAPKGVVADIPGSGDTVSILFYSGSSSDSEEVDILETIKVGDKLTLNQYPENEIYEQFQQNPRVVTRILNVDKVETNSYTSPGVSTDTTLERPVTWCKQTSDIVVNGKNITKNRPEYEPIINPTTRLIKSVSAASTQIYVENVLPLFLSNNEDLTSSQTSLSIVDTNPKVSASATAIVSVAGTISSIVITDGGVGYTTSPSVTIANPVGLGTTQRASGIASISSDYVSLITITNPGVGYTSSNPPAILIEANPYIRETISKQTFSCYGDFGIVVGVGTTSIVGVASTGVTFDLFLPTNSVFRDNLIVGTSKTVSGIGTNDYILINNTNIGSGVTSLNNSGSIIGIGTTFSDNVYQVATISRVNSIVPGVGSTSIVRIVCNVSNYSSIVGIASTAYYGDFSWGRIDVSSRSLNSYPFSVDLSGGLSGLSTAPVIIRDKKLKYYGYKLTP